jgi:hypothetical protein
LRYKGSPRSTGFSGRNSSVLTGSSCDFDQALSQNMM